MRELSPYIIAPQKELPQKIALGIRCISLVNQQEVHEAIVSDDGNAHRNERVDDSGEPSEASQQGGLQPRLLAFIARQTKPLWGRNDPCDNLQTKEGPTIILPTIPPSGKHQFTSLSSSVGNVHKFVNLDLCPQLS